MSNGPSIAQTQNAIHALESVAPRRACRKRKSNNPLSNLELALGLSCETGQMS